MITIHKYLHLDLSILNVGSAILNILKEKGTIKYHELLSELSATMGEKINSVFIPALSFLYGLGKINYRQDNNIIEYLK